MTTLEQDIESIWPGAGIVELEYQSADLNQQGDRFMLLTLDHVQVSTRRRGDFVEFVTRLTVGHSNSPVTITYTLDPEKRAPAITLGGLYYGDPGDRQVAIRVVDYLRSRLSRRGPKTLDIYDRPFQRLLAGADPAIVHDEFLEQNPEKSESAYKNAMYRRRQWLKKVT